MEEERYRLSKTQVLAAFAFVIALWLGTLWFGLTFFPNWERRGQFGDLFGSVNALFSGLAFLGVVVAILLQRQELSLQRQELRLQRQEMIASREQLTAQASAQYALALATIGQIRAAGAQVRTEALKIDAESRTPSHRMQWIDEIKAAAMEIENLADAVESTVKSHTVK
jgi:hypothetical protein